MARVFVDGREVEVPRNILGQIDIDSLRERLNLRHGRDLILQRDTGGNFLLPRSGRFRIDPFAYVTEVGKAKRGL